MISAARLLVFGLLLCVLAACAVEAKNYHRLNFAPQGSGASTGSVPAPPQSTGSLPEQSSGGSPTSQSSSGSATLPESSSGGSPTGAAPSSSGSSQESTGSSSNSTEGGNCLADTYPTSKAMCWASGPQSCCAPHQCFPIPTDSPNTACFPAGACLSGNDQSECWASGPFSCCAGSTCRPQVSNGQVVTRCVSNDITGSTTGTPVVTVPCEIPASQCRKWAQNDTGFTQAFGSELAAALNCDASQVTVIAVSVDCNSASNSTSGNSTDSNTVTAQVSCQVQGQGSTPSAAQNMQNNLNGQQQNPNSALASGKLTRFASKKVMARVSLKTTCADGSSPASGSCSGALSAFVLSWASLALPLLALASL